MANGPIRRSRRVWQLHLEGDDVHTFVVGDHAVRGYAIVRFGRSASPDEKPLYVRELVADDHHAYEALLDWLAAQQDTWRIILYEAAPDERFGHRLVEPRAPGFAPVRNAWAPVARLIRGPMLRIIDVVAALESRRTWGRVAPLRFGLEVRDAQVPENDGSFVVDFDGAGVRVTRGSVAPGVRLPVQTLAQVFSGELRVADALMLGLAEADGDVDTIDLALRVERCFRLLDEF
jgi:predicted acetyltransferase